MQPGSPDAGNKASKWRIARPSPALIVAIVALLCALTGTAYAALGKNTVGTKQLKNAAVTTGKIHNNAVNGAKVAKNSLTGEDINVSALGTVPDASHAGSGDNANTVGGHAAACPSGTTLIRGVCFDSAPSGPVNGVKAASDACAAKGGYLPTPLELYSVRGVINLGTGVGTDYQFTDSFYGNTSGSSYTTVTVNGSGTIQESGIGSEGDYVCAYALVR
jgi:hypothetical protein